ncbi:hypothetical protein AOP6_0336 [Desulfuromonas sp. AOP6]|nr:hypothetical protein AOP6_0336 [Desulfuromonas sp. AOP6]
MTDRIWWLLAVEKRMNDSHKAEGVQPLSVRSYLLKKTGWGLFLAMLLCCGPSATVLAADTLTLGVFAYRPKPILQDAYQPLADYLSGQLKGAKVELRVLEMAEIEPALAAGELDLLFTNPSHYTVLRHRNPLTGALATLISIADGKPTCSLGGVIIARQERTDLVSLKDLRGRRLAVPGTRFLGGYQTQAFELLQAGIQLPADAAVLVAESHDAVVQKVLDGEVDAGFIRTSIIEQLTAEGVLDPVRLRVVHPQEFPGFPYLVSTRLYPEWPFVALPQVDSRHVKRITAALLALDVSHPVARAAGIGGFAPPADYTPVDELARALRLPPYDQAPVFTWRDIWDQYEILIVVIVTFLGVTGLLLILIVRSNRALELAYREQQQERQKAQNYLDTVQTLMLALDDQGRITMINRFGCELLGYSEAELMGKLWFSDCLPQPEGMERIYPFFQKILGGGIEVEQAFENLVQCRDGSQRLLTWQIALLKDNGGRVMGTLSSGQDITEQRLAQEALQEERQRLANILWGTGTGTWEWNVQTGETRFNERWAQMIGYSLAEIAPVSIATWEKYAHPDDLARSAEALQRHFDGEVEDYECETRMKHRDGHWVWVLDRGRIISRDDVGQPLWMAGTHLEITARKETEMALRQSEEYHRSVVEVLAEGIIIQDVEGRIIECNPSAKRILGLSDEAIRGSLLMELGEKAVRADGSPYPPDQYPVRRCRRDKQPIYDDVVGIHQASGNILWLSLNTQPVYDTKEQEGGRASLLAIVTSFVDITTQRQQQQQLEFLAHYDALTQLPNRVLLVDRLKQAMAQVKRRNQQLATVYIDLDGFKEVNDRYGHDVGDELLKTLAERLRGVLREVDTVARMGGDEFIAILSDLSDSEAVVPLIERLLECCSQPFEMQGLKVQVSGSIGVTFYPQIGSVEATQLMAQADHAMYQAKQSGKNRYCLFSGVGG